MDVPFVLAYNAGHEVTEKPSRRPVHYSIRPVCSGMASQLFLVEKGSTTKTKRPLGMAKRKIKFEEAQNKSILIRGVPSPL